MPENENMTYRFEDLRASYSKLGDVASTVMRVSELLNVGPYLYWEGKAFDAYVGRINRVRKDLNNLYEELRKSQEKLDKAIEKQFANELDIKTEVEKLTSQDIF